MYESECGRFQISQFVPQSDANLKLQVEREGKQGQYNLHMIPGATSKGKI